MRTQEGYRRLEGEGDPLVTPLDLPAPVLVGHAPVGDVERVRERQLFVHVRTAGRHDQQKAVIKAMAHGDGR